MVGRVNAGGSSLTIRADASNASAAVGTVADAAQVGLEDRGAIAYQSFLLDFTPHLLLIAISVSGLMLTVSSLWFGSRRSSGCRKA